MVVQKKKKENRTFIATLRLTQLIQSLIEILIENVSEHFTPVSDTNHVWRYKNIYSLKIRSSYQIENMFPK